MKHLLLFLVLCALNVAPASVFAQPATAPAPAPAATDNFTLPPGGEPILEADPLASAKLAQKDGQGATMSIVDAAGPGFTRALRVDTGRQSLQQPDVRIQWPAQIATQGSDVLFLTFYARVIETTAEVGEGIGRVTFTNPTAKVDGIFFPKGVNFGSTWKRWYMPLVLRQGGPVGSVLALELGGTGTGKQTVEIGGIEFLNYRDRVKDSVLPFRRNTYKGREADAAWRKRAAERIEKYRKGDLNVRVEDAAGRAVPNAQVQVKMTRHAYKFGNGGWERFYNPQLTSKDAQKYRATTLELFNKVIMGRGTIWSNWLDPAQKAATLESVRWLRENDITLHGGGHLIWPSWKHSPASVEAEYKTRLARDGEAPAREWLREQCRAQIRDVMTTLRGQVQAYNVICETRGNRDFAAILGRQELAEWFKIARQTDPNAQLFTNENSVERPGEKADIYAETIQFLLDNGAPIDAIGLQGHVGVGDIEEFEKSLDRFGKFNIPLEITEFDLVTPDEELQSDFTRDYLTLNFSHPATRAFAVWGHWDGQHWLSDAAIYNRDWSLKASGQAYKDLVLGEWWTDVQGTSDNKGDYKTRGFLGDYEISVTHGGKTQTLKTSLPREGQSVTLKVE